MIQEGEGPVAPTIRSFFCNYVLAGQRSLCAWAGSGKDAKVLKRTIRSCHCAE
jgi:hypothetical protein